MMHTSSPARVLLGVAAAACLAGLVSARGEDLYDPAEAELFRRKDRPLTGRILDSADTQPATRTDESADPATQPESPFAAPSRLRPDVLPGYIELSDGTILPGLIYTTREKPWSVFEDESGSFRRIPPVVVRRIDAEVLWERDEPEWRWKEQGSDEKVYTGRSYPARMLRYGFTLADGQRIAGTVQQPIYVQVDGGKDADGQDVVMQFVLHERQKGPLGARLPSLVYVRHVHLGPEALARGKELARKRATTRPAEIP